MTPRPVCICLQLDYPDLSDVPAEDRGQLIVPCGLIAWSMFNDTYRVYKGSQVGLGICQPGRSQGTWRNENMSVWSVWPADRREPGAHEPDADVLRDCVAQR